MSATEASTGGAANPAAGASAGGGATTGFRIARQANPSEGDGIVRVDVVKFPCTIGRSPDADIRFDHPSVSLRHAELRMGPDGPVLVDTGRQGDGSTNGTFLGNQGRDKLTPGVEKRWPVGVPARVGQRWMRLERQAAAGAGAGAPGRAAVGGAVATVAGGVAAGVVGGGTPAGAGHVAAGVSRAAGMATGAAAGAAGGTAAGGAQGVKAEKGGITITRVPALQLEVGGRADGAVVVTNSAAVAQFVRLNVVLPEELRGCSVRLNQERVLVEAGATKSIGYSVQAPAAGPGRALPTAGEWEGTVRILHGQSWDQRVEDEVAVTVMPWGALTAKLDQAKIVEGAPIRVTLENESNASREVRLTFLNADDDPRLVFHDAPSDEVKLKPGESRRVAVRTSVGGGHLVGSERTYKYRVEVESSESTDEIAPLEGEVRSKARVASSWKGPMATAAAVGAAALLPMLYFAYKNTKENPGTSFIAALFQPITDALDDLIPGPPSTLDQGQAAQNQGEAGSSGEENGGKTDSGSTDGSTGGGGSQGGGQRESGGSTGGDQSQGAAVVRGDLAAPKGIPTATARVTAEPHGGAGISIKVNDSLQTQVLEGDTVTVSWKASGIKKGVVISPRDLLADGCDTKLSENECESVKLPKGEFVFRLSAIDLDGDEITSHARVTVIDRSEPSITVQKNLGENVTAGAEYTYELTVYAGNKGLGFTKLTSDFGTGVIVTSECTTEPTSSPVDCSWTSLVAYETRKIDFNLILNSDKTKIGDTISPVHILTVGPDKMVPVKDPPSKVISEAALRIEKTVDMSTAVPGRDTLNYTITVTNNGPSDVADAAIEDTLPPELESITAPSGCPLVGSKITCNDLYIPSPTNEQANTKEIKVSGKIKADASGTLSNFAEVKSSIASTEQSLPASTELKPEYDLGLSDYSTESKIGSDEELQLKIKIHNNGYSNFSGSIGLLISSTGANHLDLKNPMQDCEMIINTTTLKCTLTGVKISVNNDEYVTVKATTGTITSGTQYSYTVKFDPAITMNTNDKNDSFDITFSGE